MWQLDTACCYCVVGCYQSWSAKLFVYGAGDAWSVGNRVVTDVTSLRHRKLMGGDALSRFGLYFSTGISLLVAPFVGIFPLVVIGGESIKLGMLVGGGVGTLLLVAVLRRFFKMKKMLDHNYQWYRMQNPDCVQGKRLLCHSCGSEAIRVRGLMRRTFMREHFCGRCGEVLYFSPEST